MWIWRFLWLFPLHVSTHILQLSLQHAVCKIMTSCETEVIHSNVFNQETNWKTCNLLPKSVNPHFFNHNLRRISAELDGPDFSDSGLCDKQIDFYLCFWKYLSCLKIQVIKISFEGIFLGAKQKLRLLTHFL